MVFAFPLFVQTMQTSLESLGKWSLRLLLSHAQHMIPFLSPLYPWPIIKVKTMVTYLLRKHSN